MCVMWDLLCQIFAFIHHKYLFVLCWGVLWMCLYASSYSHAGNDPGTMKGCSHLTFLSTMEIPPAKQNSCYVHFSYFWLPYTVNKSTTCAAGILLSILFYRVYIYSWERLPQSIRLLIPRILSLVIHCVLVAWSIGTGFLYVVNNIPEYSFDSSKGAYGEWKPILDLT